MEHVSEQLRACLAHVFHIPIDRVPQFCWGAPGLYGDPPIWELDLAEWLRGNKLDLYVVTISTQSEHWTPNVLTRKHIRIDGHRAAVYLGDQRVYDPAPNQPPTPLNHYPQSYLLFGRS
jgi:hypothetical protein